MSRLVREGNIICIIGRDALQSDADHRSVGDVLVLEEGGF